jgi:hypothetical protein
LSKHIHSATFDILLQFCVLRLLASGLVDEVDRDLVEVGAGRVEVRLARADVVAGLRVVARRLDRADQPRRQVAVGGGLELPEDSGTKKKWVV